MTASIDTLLKKGEWIETLNLEINLRNIVTSFYGYESKD